MTTKGNEYFIYDINRLMKNLEGVELAQALRDLTNQFEDTNDYGRCYACGCFIKDEFEEQDDFTYEYCNCDE